MPQHTNVNEHTTKIKQVRERTGCGVLEAKDALMEVEWDVNAAADIVETTQKERKPKDIGYQGVFHYNHNNRIAALVTLGCNTDFVGKLPEFVALGNDIAQQVVGAAPLNVEELLKQDFIKTPGVKISDMLNDLSRKTQENIVVVRFHRVQA